MKKLSIFLIILITTILIISILTIFVVAKDYNDNGNSNKEKDSDSKSNSDNSESKTNENNEKSDNQGKNSDENQGKNSDEKVDIKTVVDENGRKVKVETKTETNGKGETKTKEKRTFIDENGNKVTIETETEVNENGETETEVKRKIVTSDGKEIVFKTKTETENGKTETKTSIEIEGIGFETKLTVKEETENGKTILKAKLSTGAEQEIITQPDEILKTALAEIGGKNITIELSEAIEDNQRTAVFKAKTTNPGKFLGIFNVNVDLETLIDTEKGAIIKTNRPWWAFLVVGHNKATVCHVSEENKRVTLNIAIPAVKAHLAHGDSVGECPLVCGDSLVVNPEQCDDGNTNDGDGCSSQCQIEITQPIIEPAPNETPINKTTITTA